jgi:hypothetical protein
MLRGLGEFARNLDLQSRQSLGFEVEKVDFTSVSQEHKHVIVAGSCYELDSRSRVESFDQFQRKVLVYLQ